jgi:hypothetical protein
VLERADESSSLAASLFSAAELLEDRIDTTVNNGVCWGTWSALVAALSHFLEFGTKLELLGSRGSGGCPLDPRALSLRLVGVIRLSVGCPRFSRWHMGGIVVVVCVIFVFLLPLCK